MAVGKWMRGIFAAVLCMTLAACGEAPAHNLEFLLGDDFQIERAPDRVEITQTIRTLEHHRDLFDSASYHVVKVANWMSKTGKWANGRLMWKVIVPMVDRYGRDSSRQVLILAFGFDELRKINYDGFPIREIVNFAEVVDFDAAARKAVTEYCSVPVRVEEFCEKITRVAFR